MLKDPFPPEGRGPAETIGKNNNGTKSTVKNAGVRNGRSPYTNTNKKNSFF
jgi:hypothetical protein